MIINDYFTLIVHNEIEYKVTIQNLHIRANQEAPLKNIIDEMLSNMSIVNGSLRSNYYEVLAGVSTELALPSALANPNMSVDGQKINVKLSEPFSLVSPSYNEDFNVVTRYQVVMTYKLKVNTVEPPLAAGVNSLLQKNTVRVFFTNNPSELYYASATNDNVAYNKILDADTTDLDQDPTTLSHLNASVNATILNDQSYFATMSKTVNIPIYNIDVHEDGRTYEIKIVNTGSTDFTIDHFVDLLPKYETLVTGSLEVIDATGVSVSPNVNVDKYTESNGDKFERLTVSSPVTVYSAITSNVTPSTTIIRYKTHVDKDMVLAKMASDQKSNIADQTNRFGFYTHANQPEIMGITRISDEGEGNGGWDNNVTTQHRYTAQVALRYIANNIAPTIDVKTNTISVSNNKEVYSTYNPNTDFVNPGENIAYNILIGNSNLSNTQTIEAGSKVVMILHKGISYLGYGHKADGTVEDYPFLDAVVSVNDANGNSILIWNVNTTINKNTNKTFRIRVSTENYKFTTYRSEALFVPKQTIEQKSLMMNFQHPMNTVILDT